MTGLVGVRSGYFDVCRPLLAVALLGILAGNSFGASPAEICAARKYKATGRKLYGKAKCHQKSLSNPAFATSECLANVEAQFRAAFDYATRHVGCEVWNNANEVEAVVEDCVARFTGAITGDAKCAAAKTKAIGRMAYDEMTCRRRAVLRGEAVAAQCLDKAVAHFTSAIAKADGFGTCSDTAPALETLVDQCMSGLNPGCGPHDNYTCGGSCDPGWVCEGEPFSGCACIRTDSCSLSEPLTCGGTCDAGQACAAICGFGCYCACVPSCLTSEAPTCGGTCPDGQVCGQASGWDFCTCVSPDDTCSISEAPTCGGTCPDGQLCGQLSGTNRCGCVSSNMTCTITQGPVCGGACPSGDVCQGENACFCACDPILPCPFGGAWGTQGNGDGQFTALVALAIDANGNVFVLDDDQVQKFTNDGVFVTRWGSHGVDDGLFYQPSGIAVDGEGNVFVADSLNQRIQKFTNDGAFLTKWGSLGSGDGQFLAPRGVAVDPDGNVYVTDQNNHRVQKFSNDGIFLDKWGQLGSGNGDFAFPSGIAVGGGLVFVADLDTVAGTARIEAFTTAGDFVTAWGSRGSGEGQFSEFYGLKIAIGPSGKVYVADDYRVHEFTVAGTFVRRWGCDGTAEGQLGGTSSGHGVAVDASERLFVADPANFRIQKFACP